MSLFGTGSLLRFTKDQYLLLLHYAVETEHQLEELPFLAKAGTDGPLGHRVGAAKSEA